MIKTAVNSVIQPSDDIISTTATPEFDKSTKYQYYDMHLTDNVNIEDASNGNTFPVDTSVLTHTIVTLHSIFRLIQLCGGRNLTTLPHQNNQNNQYYQNTQNNQYNQHNQHNQHNQNNQNNYFHRYKFIRKPIVVV